MSISSLCWLPLNEMVLVVVHFEQNVRERTHVFGAHAFFVCSCSDRHPAGFIYSMSIKAAISMSIVRKLIEHRAVFSSLVIPFVDVSDLLASRGVIGSILHANLCYSGRILVGNDDASYATAKQTQLLMCVALFEEFKDCLEGKLLGEA